MVYALPKHNYNSPKLSSLTQIINSLLQIRFLLSYRLLQMLLILPKSTNRSLKLRFLHADPANLIRVSEASIMLIRCLSLLVLLIDLVLFFYELPSDAQVL